MDLLMHNFVADMYGPYFLIFYSSIVLLTMIASRMIIRRADYTETMPVPQIPTNPDAYEIAYLRGGENETARAVIFQLIQNNLLLLDPNSGIISRSSESPSRRQLTVMERRVLDWFQSPHAVSDIFKSDGLTAQLKPFCATYEQRLQAEKFLAPSEVKNAARKALYLGWLNILALGGYKLMVALAKGKHNVALLLILMVIAFVAMIKVCLAPRLSKRGVAYLERLRTAFEQLRSQPKAATLATANAASVDPTLPLLVGVFGVTALAGTPYDYYQQTFRRAAVSGDGGVYSTSSGCGSSCSSSGGGGCGGGGCGGGGCGGCS